MNIARVVEAGARRHCPEHAGETSREIPSENSFGGIGGAAVENAGTLLQYAGVYGFRKKTLATDRMQHPLPILHCPSRREPRVRFADNTWFNADPMTFNAKGDYAANGGTFTRNRALRDGPRSIAQADGFDWPNLSLFTGVVHIRSEVSTRQISDGTTNTIYAGEKYLDPDKYETFQNQGRNNAGDDDGAYVGLNYDNVRWIKEDQFVPRQDQLGLSRNSTFGSAHPNGWHVTLCDGSVHLVSYSADLVTLMNLANRADGMVVDDTAL